MRKKSEILNEIDGVAKTIGIDSFECAALNSKGQQIMEKIQGNLKRLEQLNSEEFIKEDAPHDNQTDINHPSPH